MKFDISKYKKVNIGKQDRMIRVVVGALLLYGVYNGGSWIVGLIALALLASAYFQFCPAYLIAGIDTTTKDHPPAGQ